jgi:hypothetical protein
VNTQECIDDLLMRGCDDWVDVAEVISVAKFTGHARSAEEVRDLSLKLIREVVQQGLMEIGDLPDQGRCLKLWPIAPQQCLDRMEREWDALGRNPSLGEICWLQNTDKGNTLGEQLLKRRNAGQ